MEPLLQSTILLKIAHYALVGNIREMTLKLLKAVANFVQLVASQILEHLVVQVFALHVLLVNILLVLMWHLAQIVLVVALQIR